ncbi:MAG TPA: tail fiber protein [Sphingomicrobium sp.]|nr:tail fiber protein [Sphingomicrobium sp.]
MAQPYVGEIRMFGGNFAPAGWAFCNGALLPISENETLFQLIGTTYGGDGESTFGLPNLQGRVPIHMGQGPGLQNYILAEAAGVESVTLTTQQIPSHQHALLCTSGPATDPNPQNDLMAEQTAVSAYQSQPAQAPPMAPAISPTGGSQPHENMQPYLCVSFIISLFGIFPQQN